MNMICRICLGSGSMNLLLGVKGDQLFQKIQAITPVRIVLHEKLPARICWNCTEKVEACLVFLQQIEKSDEIFKKWLEDETLQVDDDVAIKSNAAVDNNESHAYSLLGNNNNFKSAEVAIDVCSETLECIEMYVKVDQQEEKAPRIADAPIENSIEANGINVCIQNKSYCQICLKQFIKNDINSLIAHAKTHFGENGIIQNECPFTCELCNKMFKTRYKFVSHQRAHLELKPFRCSKCKYKFSDLDLLNDHKADCGSEKHYPCKFCGRMFKSKQDLNRHQNAHEVTNPLECDLCGKLFSSERTYKEHIRKHTVGKLYVCEVCSKSYYTKSHLRKHQGTHGMSHLCSICGKAFASNSDLNRHLVYHNREKQFTCNVCKFKFFEHSHLKEHKNAKHNQESYACEICGKLLSSSRSLKMHQKCHRPVNSDSQNVNVTELTPSDVRNKNSFAIYNQVESRSLINKTARNVLDNQNPSNDTGFILITEANQNRNEITTVAAAKDVKMYVLAGDTITFDA